MGLAQLLGAPPSRIYSISLTPGPFTGTAGTTGAANPYAPRGGLLSLLGLKDPSLIDALRPLLQDVGYGLAKGTNFSEGLSLAAQHGAEMAPQREQQRLQADQWQQSQQATSSPDS